MELRGILLMGITVSTVLGKFGPDKSVCDMNQYVQNAKVQRGPTRPTIPDTYSVRIEVDMVGQNYTVDMHEFYDKGDNRGAVHIWEGGVYQTMIMLYDTGELITLDYGDSDAPRCRVEDLAKSSRENVFGLVRSKNGSEHIMTGSSVLRFDNSTPEVYVGRATARDGILVDAWESCRYDDLSDATLHVVWYFSAKDVWTTAERVVAPIEADVYKVTHVNSSYSYQSIQKYVFTEFTPGVVSSREFETPPMTYCPDRVSSRDPPKISKTFSFSAEVIKPMEGFVNFIKEYYDFNLRLFRYDYTPDPEEGRGSNQLIRVHDFHTGLAYEQDPMLGNCTISAITGGGLDSHQINSMSLRMRTSEEFFDLANTTSHYTGQRKVRGIPTDVFAALRYQTDPNTTTLWEWYFASQDWMDNAGYVLVFYQPIMLQVTSRVESQPLNYIYNIYDYTEDDPDIWKTDLSSCFNYTHRRDYTVMFNDSHVKDVQKDLDGFKSAVIQSAANFATVSPIRITNIEVDFIQNFILASFTLLDSHPMPVNVKIDKPIPNLSAAAFQLDSVIEEGAFFITMLPNYITMHAQSGS